MLLMRLKLAASGSKFGVGRTCGELLEPVLNVFDGGDAGFENGIDFVVFVAADLAEIMLEPLQHEVTNLAGNRVGRSSSRASPRPES